MSMGVVLKIVIGLAFGGFSESVMVVVTLWG